MPGASWVTPPHATVSKGGGRLEVVSCCIPSLVSNQQDHDPPSRSDPLESTVTVHCCLLGSIIIHHLGPGPPPLYDANDKGSTITTTISPHDTESTKLDQTGSTTATSDA
ncbi:unnamed protein product [Pleuronectes platessa]|uniref:Uncharacterized protein n=1 Tax=Pleuronectes platessa TaxID=8262 RepID=A0A9N7TUA4_PLEPL|nr:unnamed protein product [Pleuronectes platessa]